MFHIEIIEIFFLKKIARFFMFLLLLMMVSLTCLPKRVLLIVNIQLISVLYIHIYYILL